MGWWIWSAWIITAEGPPRPFYSFAAQTQSPERGASTESISLPSGAVLQICDAILSAAMIAPFLSYLTDETAEIDLSPYLPGAPKTVAVSSRRIVTRAFGHDAISSLVKYGMPDPEILFCDTQDTLPLVDACTSRLGLPFRSEFAIHLGGFDLFEMRPWFESPPPYGLQVLKRAPQPQSDGVRIWRTEHSEDEVAHVLLRSDGETVVNRIVILRAGEASADISVFTILDSIELSVFRTADGQITFHEANHFIREANINMMTLGRTLQLTDALSKKVASATGGTKATATTSVRSMRSSIGLDPTRLRAYRSKIATFLDHSLPKDSADRWFSRGLDAEFDTIEYLNKLVEKTAARAAILVDPYFGIGALERVMLRIRQSDLKFTVVTSWGRIEPDTGQRLDYGRDLAEEGRKRLARVLTVVGPHIAPAFQFINIITTSDEQAFHDRYLLLESVDGAPRVFLLSNSLNGMAVNWPFCVSELEGRARHDAAAYIRGLADGRDITGAAQPKISFRWPENSNPSATA